MNILHTEASRGWGGQEMRILREAEGMRLRGHQVFFAVEKKGVLADEAKKAGFPVYEFPIRLRTSPLAIYRLISLIRKHNIHIINTHSSADAWLGGIAAKLLGRKVIRTRHLSTPIRQGWNSVVLYNYLADFTVTTCEDVAITIRKQAHITDERCLSIPTGINPNALHVSENEIEAFRNKWGLSSHDCVVGTACVLRSWKGIDDFLKAAQLLQDHLNLKWIIVGEGPAERYFQELAGNLKIRDKVIFTGHLSPPFSAMAVMDIFILPSTKNEGVSQATLQAAFLHKPLITTTVGGLSEVCLDGVTGYLVPPFSSQTIAEKILILAKDKTLRDKMGREAHQLVSERFTLDKTLNSMEYVYKSLFDS